MGIFVSFSNQQLDKIPRRWLDNWKVAMEELEEATGNEGLHRKSLGEAMVDPVGGITPRVEPMMKFLEEIDRG